MSKVSFWSLLQITCHKARTLGIYGKGGKFPHGLSKPTKELRSYWFKTRHTHKNPIYHFFLHFFPWGFDIAKSFPWGETNKHTCLICPSHDVTVAGSWPLTLPFIQTCQPAGGSTERKKRVAVVPVAQRQVSASPQLTKPVLMDLWRVPRAPVGELSTPWGRRQEKTQFLPLGPKIGEGLERISKKVFKKC